MKRSIGLDIGGTKCAITVGEIDGDDIKIVHREEFPTAGLTWQQVLAEFAARITRTLNDSIAFPANKGVLGSVSDLSDWNTMMSNLLR